MSIFFGWVLFLFGGTLQKTLSFSPPHLSRPSQTPPTRPPPRRPPLNPHLLSLCSQPLTLTPRRTYDLSYDFPVSGKNIMLFTSLPHPYFIIFLFGVRVNGFINFIYIFFRKRDFALVLKFSYEHTHLFVLDKIIIEKS